MRKRKVIVGILAVLVVLGMAMVTAFGQPEGSQSIGGETPVESTIQETPGGEGVPDPGEQEITSEQEAPSQTESSAGTPPEGGSVSSEVTSWYVPSEDPIYSAPTGDGTSEGTDSIVLPEVDVPTTSHSKLPSAPEKGNEDNAIYGVLTGVGLLVLTVAVVWILFGNFRAGKSTHSSGRLYAKKKNYPQRKHLLADKYYSRSGRKRRY